MAHSGKLVCVLDSNGDLIGQAPLSTEATALPLSLNAQTFGTHRFEVNYFHVDDVLCYEFYEVDTGAGENNYIDVRIPDASPDSGPFIPVPSDRVTLTMYGQRTLAWPVFRRFLKAIRAAGDIVDSVTDQPDPVDRL